MNERMDGIKDGGRSFRLVSRTEEDTIRVGESMAPFAFPGLVVLLVGGLGAGKTTLVRGFCRARGCSNVRSPSFTLVNRYECREGAIIHADLYRLGRVDPEELDMEDYMDEEPVLFIEWADRGLPWSFDQVWTVRFGHAGDDGSREITLSAEGDRAISALDAFAEDYPGGMTGA